MCDSRRASLLSHVSQQACRDIATVFLASMAVCPSHAEKQTPSLQESDVEKRASTPTALRQFARPTERLSGKLPSWDRLPPSQQPIGERARQVPRNPRPPIEVRSARPDAIQ